MFQKATRADAFPSIGTRGCAQAGASAPDRAYAVSSLAPLPASGSAPAITTTISSGFT